MEQKKFLIEGVEKKDLKQTQNNYSKPSTKTLASEKIAIQTTQILYCLFQGFPYYLTNFTPIPDNVPPAIIKIHNNKDQLIKFNILVMSSGEINCPICFLTASFI